MNRLIKGMRLKAATRPPGISWNKENRMIDADVKANGKENIRNLFKKTCDKMGVLIIQNNCVDWHIRRKHTYLKGEKNEETDHEC